MKLWDGIAKLWFKLSGKSHEEHEVRKALFIGINHYSYVSPLSGCCNDAMEMSSVLKTNSNGSPNFDCRVFTTAEDALTKTKIEDEVQKLFSGSAEIALLFFAGHGAFDNSVDEGMLISQDCSKAKEGIRISDILKWATDATNITNKVIILDCCQSGAAGVDRQLKGGSTVLGDGVTILTACRKDEVALEDNETDHGVFTKLLIQALSGGAANVQGQVTPGAIYSFVDGALGPWDQRPVFKTNVSSFCSLRTLEAKVPPETLRKLPEWFPQPSDVYPLTPAYEPTEKSHDKQLGDIFAQLQKCNRHGLIEPVDAEHMYYAAIESKGCRLTALGAYYRELAMKGRI